MCSRKLHSETTVAEREVEAQRYVLTSRGAASPLRFSAGEVSWHGDQITALPTSALMSFTLSYSPASLLPLSGSARVSWFLRQDAGHRGTARGEGSNLCQDHSLIGKSQGNSWLIQL